MKIWILIFSALFCHFCFSEELWNLDYQGISLEDFSVNNNKLSISFGKGEEPIEDWKVRYQDLKSKGQKLDHYPFQWQLIDLSNNQVMSQSKNIEKVFYGASTTKIMVGSAFLQIVDNPIRSPYWQDLLDMIVISSNPAWKKIQFATGRDDMEQGRLEVHLFARSLGLERTRAFWGYSTTMNGLHGNEINVIEFNQFMRKLYYGEFYGSELIFKIMLAGQKGYDMSKRFLPKEVKIANKGGRYDGETTNPDTGLPTNPDGTLFTVRVRHQAFFINYRGHDYLFSIFSDLGKEIDLSVMAYGLFKEYISQ